MGKRQRIDGRVINQGGKIKATTTTENHTMPRAKAQTVKSGQPAQPEQATAHSKEIIETLLTVKETVIAGRNCLSIKASDLHASLQVSKDFTNWIKEKIKKYQFDENADYTWGLAETSNVNTTGGRPGHEYLLTLDMAKELAMAQNNAQGRIARKYIIECETRHHQSQSPLQTQIQTGQAIEAATSANSESAPERMYTQSEVENRLRVVSKILRTSWQTTCKAYGEIIDKLEVGDQAGRKTAFELTKSLARKAVTDIEAHIEKACQGIEAAKCSDEWREQIIAAIDQHSQTSGA